MTWQQAQERWMVYSHHLVIWCDYWEWVITQCLHLCDIHMDDCALWVHFITFVVFKAISVNKLNTVFLSFLLSFDTFSGRNKSKLPSSTGETDHCAQVLHQSLLPIRFCDIITIRLQQCDAVLFNSIFSFVNVLFCSITNMIAVNTLCATTVL